MPREPAVQLLQLFYDATGPNAVHVSERSPPERWEPDPEYRPNVAIPRGPKNSLLETARGLIDHRQHAAFDDLGGWNLATLATDDFIDGLVHRAFLSGFIISVQALTTLAARSARLDDVPHRLRRSHAVAERLEQHLADLSADVDSHFVEQRHGPHGEAEVDERLIHRFYRGAFVEQTAGF